MSKRLSLPNVHQRKDGMYVIQWTATLADGKTKRMSASSTSEEKCVAKYQRINEEIVSNAYIEKNGLTFAVWSDKWLNEYKSSSLSENTLYSYRTLLRTHLLPTLATLPLKKVDKSLAQSIIRKMKRNGLSSSTIRHVASLLKQILSSAVEERVLSTMPFNHLDLPPLVEKEHLPFSNEELKKIYDEMYRPTKRKVNPAFAVATQLLMETGCRRGEALGVKWCNVDVENCCINVKSTVVSIDGKTVEKSTPKNLFSIRTLPISSDLLKKMMALERNGEYVFHVSSGKPLSPNNFQKRFMKWCIHCNVPYRSPHTLRHTFVTDLIDNNESIETVKALTGHKTDKMIRRYSHKVPQSVTIAVRHRQERMNKLLTTK